MRRSFTMLAVLVAASMLCVTAAPADDDDDEGHGHHGRRDREFRTTLLGDNETPPINTTARATLRLTVAGTDTIHFELTYENLSAAPGAAHIHFAPRRVNGGVLAFFCGGGGQAACPATTSGTVSGDITAASIGGIATQGVGAGDFAAVLDALGEGLVYANMHNAKFPGGEIRGQVR